MRRLLLLACVSAALAACGGGAPRQPERQPEYGSRPPPVVASPGNQSAPNPLARSVTYTCEDLSTIVLTEGTPSAMATLNSGLELKLARLPDAGGLRYGAPPYEFRGRGGDGTWQTGDKLWRCRAK